MPPRLASARLVGRDAELTRLAGILDDAATGSARTLLVTGSSGAGITRFLAEASTRLAASAGGWAVLRAGVPAGGADEPYGPIVRALTPYLVGGADAELARLASTAAPSLATLVPELADRLNGLGLAGARPEVMPGELAQGWVLERLLGVAGRIAGDRPLLFTIEDLHRADSATRAFVSFVARGSTERRLCLVGTYAEDELTRDSPLRADLAELRRWPRRIERLAIPALARDDLAQLIAEIEGERPTASALVLVAERSAGFPLFAEEVLAARRELSSTHLAGDFDAIVSARLALRAPECRRVVRLLAAAARPLSRDQLADLDGRVAATTVGRVRSSATAPRLARGVLEADLAAGVEEALETGIAVERENGLEIRHELIAQAVMRDVLPGDRPRYHASVAVTLAGQPAVAAHHWRLAGRLELAGDAAVAAADRAAAVAAPLEELGFLEAALEFVSVAPRPPTDDRETLQLRAAEAAFSAGRASRAVAYAEAAMETRPGRADRESLGEANERLGRYRRAAGDHAGALSAHRRAADLAAHSAPAERAHVLASLAQVLMLHGTFSEAEQQAEAAIEQAAAAGPNGAAELVRATTTLGVALAWGHEPERGFGLLEAARDQARERGDLDELFRVYANLTTVLDLLGRRDEAVRVAYEGVDAAREAGLEQVYGEFLRSNAAESLFLLGRWAESRAFAAAGWTSDATSRATVNSMVNLAVLEIETEAGEAAENLLGQLLLTLETVNDPQHAVPVYRAAAALALWLGDLADARRMSDRGWSQVRTTEDWILAAKMAATVAEVDAMAASNSAGPGDLAAILAARGRTGMVLREAGVLVRASGAPAATGSRREADAYLQAARAFQARIDGLDDPEAWKGLAATWTSLGNRYEVARARWREAEAALTVGGGSTARARAREAVEAAATIAIDLGANPMLRALADLAGRGRLPLTPPVRAALARLAPPDARPAADQSPPAPATEGSPSAADLLRDPAHPPTRPGEAFGLSRRERDVLALIVQGRTNREIGERLFISQKTVGVHVGNILAKLNVSGRVEAATVAIRLGLLDP